MKSVLLLLILISLFGLQSCKKDSSNPVIPIDNTFTYPLKIGNSWTYNSITTFSNMRPDSIRNYINAFTDSMTMVVKVTRDVVLNSVHTLEMSETSTGNTAFGYYGNTQEGMLKYAYSNNPSRILPKSNGAIKFLFHGQHYNSIQELIKANEEIVHLAKTTNDSIVYLEPPRTVYSYPFDINKEWVYNSISGMTIKKKIIGIEEITSALGTFQCYKIQFVYEPDNGLKYYEYICSKGILKITVTIKDLMISTIEYPDGIGMVDYRQEKSLTSVNF